MNCSSNNHKHLAMATHEMEKVEDHPENKTASEMTSLDDDETKKEQQIQNEPIYENISTTSTVTADAEAKIIPNHNRAKNERNQINNINNNNSNNNTNVAVNLTNAFSLNTTNGTSQEPPQPASPPCEEEPYYQVPKCSEPYYDAPKHLRPVPVYENIEVFYSGMESATLAASHEPAALKLEPPKEKPPPPPTDSPPAFDDVDSVENDVNWSSENTYETITNRLPNRIEPNANATHPSPPIKRLNSTKRIKKELRHKRSSFLGIEGLPDDDLESYLELTVAPPPDMTQLLQEERRLEKQLYLKAGLCDSSDTGESRDSGVSENHSRQSSEPFTNSSEEPDRSDEPLLCLNTNTYIKPNELIYQNEAQLLAAQTPLLQTVKGNSAESWTESATAAAAASKSLTEATATANAKMHSIEEKIREQEEVLRVERELLHLEQEELKRQRENLMLRENLARRELQHGAKMLMSANRRSLQDLHAGGSVNGANFQAASTAPVQVKPQPQQSQPQQIYANVPNLQQQYYRVDTDYRKSMSDLNEFSKRLMLPLPQDSPVPPTKPMRVMHVPNNHEDCARQRQSLNTQSYGGSLANSIGATTVSPQQSAATFYSNYQLHQSAQNLSTSNAHLQAANGHLHTNMTRNTLHALSATPKPKYTDGWVQVQNRKSFDSNLSNDPAWLSAYQQKRKSVPDAYHYSNNKTNLWLLQETEQQRLTDQQHVRSVSTACTPVHQQKGSSAKTLLGASSNGKPLPDSVIQTLTERLQSKGIGERKRFDNYHNNSNIEKSPLHAASSYQQHGYPPQQGMMLPSQTTCAATQRLAQDLGVHNNKTALPSAATAAASQDKVLSVSGKKKCSHCGDELDFGCTESNCRHLQKAIKYVVWV